MGYVKGVKSENVLDAVMKRWKYIYETIDEPICTISGGKDSMAVLYTAILAAEKFGKKLPIRALFYDDEAVTTATIDFIHYLNERKDVDLTWVCVPSRQRNAASSFAPFWYPWHPEEKDLWCRQPPPGALTLENCPWSGFEYEEGWQHPDGLPFKAQGVTKAKQFVEVMQDTIKQIRKDTKKNIYMAVGLRAKESMRRTIILLQKKQESWIVHNQKHFFPIYDWEAEDCWRLVKYTGWDYNHEYDFWNMTEKYKKWGAQRVSTPFAEESIQGLFRYRIFEPDLWNKMLSRVEGLNSAVRYTNTELFAHKDMIKPEGLSWREYAVQLSKQAPSDIRFFMMKSIRSRMLSHARQTNDPIPEENIHPLTAVSWKVICKMVIKGDWRDRQAQNSRVKALTEQMKRTEDEKRLFKKTHGRQK